MKSYLTWVVLFLALGTAIFVTACAEDSGWGASYGGAQLQPNGRPSNTGSESPPGSGSVPYVHEGPF
jgi:hypothetical protein